MSLVVQRDNLIINVDATGISFRKKIMSLGDQQPLVKGQSIQ